jgi:hypothetical protein
MTTPARPESSARWARRTSRGANVGSRERFCLSSSGRWKVSFRVATAPAGSPRGSDHHTASLWRMRMPSGGLTLDANTECAME